MKIKRFHSFTESSNGWTKWITPLPGFLLVCCDCSLTHRMNFRVHKGQVQLKAQRAVGYTKRERRKCQNSK